MLKYYSVSLLRVIARYRIMLPALLAILALSLTGRGQAAQGRSDRYAHPGQLARSGQSARAKIPNPISAKVTADHNRILIGQPIQVLIEASVAKKNSITWPALDTFPHFVFLQKGMVDSTVGPDSTTYRQSLTLTSYDSGTWSIPRLNFMLSPAGLQAGMGLHPKPALRPSSLSDSIPITIDYTKLDPKQDYHDIRDIIDVPNPFAKWIGWIVAGVCLLSVAIVIWLISLKKKLPKASSTPPPLATQIPPFEEAILQLDELARQRAWENGSVKVFYTRLNDILRLYMLRRLGISSLAETNEELIGQLRGLLLRPETFTPLTETLRMSDFVKFAKYIPSTNDNEFHYRSIRSSVEALEQIAQDREAEDRLINVMAGAGGGAGIEPDADQKT